MTLPKCPYCGTVNRLKNVVDSCHLSMTVGLHKKGNTRNIYLCPECGEEFEAFQKNIDTCRPVDLLMQRRFQYCRWNMDYYDMEDWLSEDR